jgi:hypothetical protein
MTNRFVGAKTVKLTPTLLTVEIGVNAQNSSNERNGDLSKVVFFSTNK